MAGLELCCAFVYDYAHYVCLPCAKQAERGREEEQNATPNGLGWGC